MQKLKLFSTLAAAKALMSDRDPMIVGQLAPPSALRHGYQFMPPRSQKKRRVRERRMRAAGRRVT